MAKKFKIKLLKGVPYWVFIAPIILILIGSIPIIQGLIQGCYGLIVPTPFDLGFCSTVTLGITLLPGTFILISTPIGELTFNAYAISIVFIYVISFLFHLLIALLINFFINKLLLMRD